MNGFPDFDFSSIRIMGVLQRIALCYLVAGLLYLVTFQSEPAADRPARVHANLRVTAAVAIALLVGYWALMTFVPVPGYGAGHLGKEDNLGAYIDRTLMGGHLWSESVTWDPEGFLSTLPAIASLLIGILAGEWLRSDRSAGRKALGLAAAGLVLLDRGAIAPSVFSDQQKFVDEFIRAVHRRLRDARAGRVLLDCRCARLACLERRRSSSSE